MKWILSLLLISNALFAVPSRPSAVKTDEGTLQEIHLAYEEAMKMGPINEFVKYRDYLLLLLNLSIAHSEIKGAVNYVFGIYNDYFMNLKAICEANPEEEVSFLVLDQLNPFLETFDKERIEPCFMLFQFGIGDLTFLEDHQALQRVVIEFAVKNHMVTTFYKNHESEKNRLCDLLEREKMRQLRAICLKARDPFMKNVLYDEILHVQTLRDYWDRYTFSLEYLNELRDGIREPQSSMEESLRLLLIDFSVKIDEMKREYGEYIGMA